MRGSCSRARVMRRRLRLRISGLGFAWQMSVVRIIVVNNLSNYGKIIILDNMKKCKDCEYFGGSEGNNVWCNAIECQYKENNTQNINDK